MDVALPLVHCPPLKSSVKPLLHVRVVSSVQKIADFSSNNNLQIMA